jgi:enamine deaminase RidA (YjgF/YER057c/UK114 family)
MLITCYRRACNDGAMSAEARLNQLGIELPPPGPVAGLYSAAVRTGDLVYLSGCGQVRADGTYIVGKVGADLDVDQAREAARLTGLVLLSRLRELIGSLDHVVQVVKILGMVNTAPGFDKTPPVIDGCSELFIQVFGEAGRAARSAVGLAELPFGICVEIEAIVQVDLP